LNLAVSYDIFYFDNLYLKKLFYSYDDGFAFVNDNLSEGFIYDNTNFLRDILPAGSKEFVPNSFRAASFVLNSQEVEYYRRTSPKIQSVLADIGGMAKFITSFSLFIIKHITTNMMFVDLSNEIIDYGKTLREATKPSNIDNSIKHNTLVIEPLKKDSKDIIHHHPVSTSIPSKREKLSILHSIVPAKCLGKDSIKKKLEVLNDCIKKKLSVDYILTQMNQIEKMKIVLFDLNEYSMFDKLTNPTFNEIANPQNTERFSRDGAEIVCPIEYNTIEKRIVNYHEIIKIIKI
jgi:hypothetical protein